MEKMEKERRMPTLQEWSLVLPAASPSGGLRDT
jgi:hypothetical protein